MKIKYFSQKGQVAVIVLLISAVMLTMGLSFSKRTVVDTKIDTNEEQLRKAFNAAESGISYYLGTRRTDYVAPDGLSSADVTVNDISAGGNTINFDEFLPVENADFYWLVDHLVDGSLGSHYYGGDSVDVCGIGFTGSLKVDYFYRNGLNYGVNRYGFNFSRNVIRVENFADANPGCVTINTPNDPLLIVIRPIFNGGRFYIDGDTGFTFPSQGFDINSLGKAGGASADVEAQMQVNRRLSVRWRYQLPDFLLSAVTAEGSVLSD